jgi:OmpA-OmpF porin, OOP family
MAESLLASLLHTLDRSTVANIASSLGESEQNVSRAMESCVACVLGAMASKGDDPGALRRMLDLVPGSVGEVSWSKMAASLPNPGSGNTGKQMLPGVFGPGSDSVVSAVASDSGVSTATATTLMATTVPTVIGLVNRRVNEQLWSMRELGSALQRDSLTIRNALPVRLSDFFWQPEMAGATSASPVIAQSIQHEKTPAGWAGALALAAAALGCFWLLTHARRPVESARVSVTGEANRMADQATRLGDFVRRRLPSGVYINVPANGVESRLVAIAEGTNTLGQTWVDFDRVLFESGSATLRPDSSEQLDNVAAILKAYPNVHLRIVGLTDDVGSADQNLELSRARADSVKTELVSRGISPDRLTAEGFGEAASSDNSTAAGGAGNRRVSLQVTQR